MEMVTSIASKAFIVWAVLMGTLIAASMTIMVVSTLWGDFKRWRGR